MSQRTEFVVIRFTPEELRQLQAKRLPRETRSDAIRRAIRLLVKVKA